MQGSTDWDHIRYCGQILQHHSKKKKKEKPKNISQTDGKTYVLAHL